MEYFDYLTKILLAVIFGGILGGERGYAGKAAGMRTYMLVTLSATFFTIIAQAAPALQNDPTSVGRIISQLILGIGFLGAGIIFFQQKHIHGLTTAAGLWVSTAIGIAIGVNLYLLAAIVTLISFIILAVFPRIEDKIERQDND